MHQYLKKVIVIGMGFVLIGLYAPAGAYVLQGPHILLLMAKHLGRATSLLVDQQLTLINTPAQKDPVEFDETLRYVFPETFRSDISTENVQRMHLSTEGAILTVIDGKTATDTETVFDRYKDLLLYRSRKSLQKQLYGHGVNVMVSSLGRYNGRVAYVVGAEYPDETVPQVWVDKDTFRPFRWVLAPGSEEKREDALEVRYLEWVKNDGTWYPMQIEFYQNEVLVRKIQVKSVQVNLSFSGDLFDIGHLRTIHMPGATAVSGQSETEGLSEVQKTIEEFKKRYEQQN
ncbi:MAG: hypothetical protein JRI75_07085 [Deltaproteobacteria bacterium]|nr:hypothetical protein [Deltaproteobacteria bacterium]